MSQRRNRRRFSNRAGIRAALLVLAAFPLAVLQATSETSVEVWRGIAIVVACVGFYASSAVADRHLLLRLFSFAALGMTAIGLSHWLAESPPRTLAALAGLTFCGFAILDSTTPSVLREGAPKSEARRQGARWGAGALVLGNAILILAGAGDQVLAQGIGLLGSVIAFLFYVRWGWGLGKQHLQRRQQIARVLSLAIIPMVLLGLYFQISLIVECIAFGVAWWLIPEDDEASLPVHWIAPLIDHPARVLVSTFMILCVLGTFLLMLPIASTGTEIRPLNAVFTSVSAVCVTGLAVQDTPNDFSFWGQAILLLLIQLGGLGIMTISTVAFYVLGRRITLRHERLLHSLSDGEKGDLKQSLLAVVKFTLICELVGAVVLFALFLWEGDSVIDAVWRACFTSVSAFCNAGFALQSDSLVSYNQNPLILHAISLLIIAGGFSPATAIAFPAWVRGKSVPAAIKLALNTSLLLLVIGFFFFLVLEWQGVLSGLGFFDKLHNAWFQSVTLRTAGFNSVGYASLASPTILVMLPLMFIGGSPGGTAGGVKTATVGILSLAMWANITGRRDATLAGRRLPYTLIYRSVAIIGSGVGVWFVMTLALTVTQSIDTRDLIFESTSALATVGLSCGATSELDDLGKVIVIIGMFLGRIGPLTLFVLLGDEPRIERHHRPDTQIPLT